MNLVKQIDKEGCAIACGAMLTGRTYEQVKQELRYVYHAGVNDGVMELYLQEQGFFLRKVSKYSVITEEVKSWPPNPFADLHICRVLTSIDYHSGHLVVMDKDGKVFDPLGEIKTLSDYPKVYWVAGLYK